MKRYFPLVLSVLFLGGCVSTGVGASFSPGGGVAGSASACIDSTSSSYSKVKDVLNNIGSLGTVMDAAVSVFHCNAAPADIPEG